MSEISKLEKKFTGPEYHYTKFIKSPKEMGMSGDAKSIGNNIAGLMNYVHLLMNGKGNASKTPWRYLGNRYFYDTGGKCESSSGKVKRSLYVDNVPNGNIPWLKDMDTSSLRGLVPALLESINKMNPSSMLTAFKQPTNPTCRNIYMKTVDENNVEGTGSGFVLDNEIKGISPCAFVKGVNPVTGGICKESFIGNKYNNNIEKRGGMKMKPFANVYTALVSFLILYITYKFVNKRS